VYRYSSAFSLTSTLDGVVGQRHAPTAFTVLGLFYVNLHYFSTHEFQMGRRKVNDSEVNGSPQFHIIVSPKRPAYMTLSRTCPCVTVLLGILWRTLGWSVSFYF
jgi:hypothetical protein